MPSTIAASTTCPLPSRWAGSSALLIPQAIIAAPPALVAQQCGWRLGRRVRVATVVQHTGKGDVIGIVAGHL